MYEILSAIGRSYHIRIPDSGPGSEFVIGGTESLGYMGSMDPSVISVSNELIKFLRDSPTSTEILASKGVRWHKMVREDKILFFPSGPCGAVTYSELERLNATFGVKDPPGSLPAVLPVSRKPMYSENAIIVAKGSAFRMRLPRALTVGTTLGGVSFTTHSTSELAQTVLSLSDKVATIPPFPGIRKTDLNNPPISNPGVWSVAETSSSVTNKNITYRLDSINTSFNSVNATDLLKWSPILELIPREEYGSLALPLFDISAESSQVIHYTSSVMGKTLAATRPVGSIRSIDHESEPQVAINRSLDNAKNGTLPVGRIVSSDFLVDQTVDLAQLFGSAPSVTSGELFRTYASITPVETYSSPILERYSGTMTNIQITPSYNKE